MPKITANKKVLFDYQVIEKLEAGIVLTGAEVKAIKGGFINLKGSYVTIRGNELWLINCHISPYKMASSQGKYDPSHDRKLLLNKKEIASLIGTLKAQGLTVMPISVYTKGSLIKIEIGICRGRKKQDKRELIKRRESDRRIRRLLRNKT
ncbi:SsrA-binding protein SmpB [Patescibacteria group bacterium]|nr:SsrA-binding protein SmpB [Patescibacteria group bacterium]MBU0963839.1 SsrA-binding protein SmpB [Patescibacteria group bacterium]